MAGNGKIGASDSSLAADTIRYSYSKLCNLYFAYELGRRLEKNSGICVNAFNPGLMQTNFMPLNKVSIEVVKRTMPKRFGDLGKSSDALAELVVSKELVRGSGFIMTGVPGRALRLNCPIIQGMQKNCGVRARGMSGKVLGRVTSLGSDIGQGMFCFPETTSYHI